MKSEYPDPLLAALEVVGRLHHRSINRESAIAGLPLEDGWLTPKLFCRAAQRCGLEASIIKCKLSEIHETSLPAVILTEDGFALIMVRREANGNVEVILPETGNGTELMTKSELDRFYSGFVILVKPAYEAEQRANNSEKETGKSNWFWNALWSYRSFYARVAIATVFINFLALASSLFVMNVYDRVVPNQATETLFVLAAGVLIAFIFEFSLKSLRTFFVDRAGKQIDSKLGALLFERVLGMKLSQRPGSSGALASQARSYESLREFFTSATVATLVDLPFVFVFAGIVYLLGGIVAAPMVIGAALAVLIGLVAQIPMKKAVEQSYQANNQRHAIFVETINCLETVKTCRAESVMQRRMEESIKVSADSEQKSRWHSQQTVALVGLLQQLVNTSIIIFAFYQIMDEKMTMGAMIACVILAGRGLAPMIMLSSLLSRLQQSWRAYQGLDKLMKCPAEREVGERRIQLSSFESSVHFENVSFAYPGAPDNVSALNGIDLSVDQGERVALIGRIGSGKSTLLRMAVGLFEPAEGRVDVSGFDVRQLDPSELRGKIGFMGQESTLFYGKLRDNLTMGQPWADDSQVWASLKRSGLYEFVKSHPEGLDMLIHEGGSSLSGGQRQAICLARALLSEPDLLIFDEPTSSMDGLTEKGFVERVDAYLKEKQNRSLLMATHKSSMLELVDRVVVIEQGRVVNDGAREQVISPKSKKVQQTSPLHCVAA